MTGFRCQSVGAFCADLRTLLSPSLPLSTTTELAIQSTCSLCSRPTRWPLRADALDPYSFTFPTDMDTPLAQSTHCTLHLTAYTYCCPTAFDAPEADDGWDAMDIFPQGTSCAFVFSVMLIVCTQRAPSRRVKTVVVAGGLQRLKVCVIYCTFTHLTHMKRFPIRRIFLKNFKKNLIFSWIFMIFSWSFHGFSWSFHGFSTNVRVFFLTTMLLFRKKNVPKIFNTLLGLC